MSVSARSGVASRFPSLVLGLAPRGGGFDCVCASSHLLLFSTHAPREPAFMPVEGEPPLAPGRRPIPYIISLIEFKHCPIQNRSARILLPGRHERPPAARRRPPTPSPRTHGPALPSAAYQHGRSAGSTAYGVEESGSFGTLCGGDVVTDTQLAGGEDGCRQGVCPHIKGGFSEGYRMIKRQRGWPAPPYNICETICFHSVPALRNPRPGNVCTSNENGTAFLDFTGILLHLY